jgi:hypothetical protein
MKRCATCKHWTPPENEAFGEVPGVGWCKAAPQYWDAAEWDEDCERRILKPQYSGVLAMVKDGSDYRAELRTFPDFGCVMHELSPYFANEVRP